MPSDPHFSALERMYLAAPINELYEPTIEVREGEATIEIRISKQLFHAADAVHGSVYFKMLDDAAFFASNSLEREHLVLTSSFTTFFTRPVSGGRMRADGRVVHEGGSRLLAEAVVHDAEGRPVGRGTGAFVRSRTRLAELRGYRIGGEPAAGGEGAP